mgnify:CR=1 FL=1|jgi:hypothetical protein
MNLKSILKVAIPVGIAGLLYFGGAWWREDIMKRGTVVAERYSSSQLEDKIHHGFFENFHYQGMGDSEYVVTVNVDGSLYAIDVKDGAVSKEALDDLVDVGSEVSFKIGYKKVTRMGSTSWNTFYKRSDSLPTSDIIVH